MSKKQSPLPLISVALCTYNGSKHLREQLDSIIKQTYSNIEVIAVDDCSTDNTFQILEEYAKNDSRIKCFVNDKNLGFNKNFEKALGLTQGEYIAICDQDDIWDVNKLQQLYKAIDDYWLIFSNSSFIDDKGQSSGQLLLTNFNPNSISFATIAKENVVTGHTTLMSRELLNYILPLPNSGFYDWWIGFIAIYHNKMSYLDKVLTQYRKHDNSVVQQMHHDKDDQGIKEMLTSAKITQIDALLTYKGLSQDDRKLLVKLQGLVKDRLDQKTSLSSIGLIFKYYSILFPGFKARKGLSRINFAIRHLRGQA